MPGTSLIQPGPGEILEIENPDIPSRVVCRLRVDGPRIWQVALVPDVHVPVEHPGGGEFGPDLRDESPTALRCRQARSVKKSPVWSRDDVVNESGAPIYCFMGQHDIGTAARDCAGGICLCGLLVSPPILPLNSLLLVRRGGTAEREKRSASNLEAITTRKETTDVAPSSGTTTR